MPNSEELKAAFAELSASFEAQGHALGDIWNALVEHSNDVSVKIADANSNVIQPESEEQKVVPNELPSEPVPAAPAPTEDSGVAAPQG